MFIKRMRQMVHVKIWTSNMSWNCTIQEENDLPDQQMEKFSHFKLAADCPQSIYRSVLGEVLYTYAQEVQNLL